jgi:hypothetical protein
MRTRTAVLGSVAVGLVASAATALATIPSADGTVYGCYSAGTPEPHALSVVDDPKSCKEILLPFSARGPAGPTGPAGAAGPAGPQGAEAADDAVIYETFLDGRKPPFLADQTSPRQNFFRFTDDPVTVAVELQPGTYILNARINLWAYTSGCSYGICSAPAPLPIRCTLQVGAEEDFVREDVLFRGVINQHLSVTLSAAARATYRCSADFRHSATVVEDAYLMNSRLTATRVGVQPVLSGASTAPSGGSRSTGRIPTQKQIRKLLKGKRGPSVG